MYPPAFHLLTSPDPASPADVETLLEKLRDGTGGRRIRCPLCLWRPAKTDRWGCDCGHGWNTFETEGKCPACGHQWHVTQCLQCHQFSPHKAWYASEPEPSEQ